MIMSSKITWYRHHLQKNFTYISLKSLHRKNWDLSHCQVIPMRNKICLWRCHHYLHYDVIRPVQCLILSAWNKNSLQLLARLTQHFERTVCVPPEGIYNDNYDVICHVVQAPSWKNFAPLYLKSLHEKKLTPCSFSTTPHVE